MITLENRARKLSEMVGQPLILEEMKRRSKDLNFAQSMIFEGDTGSGKTTLALIIAALLNCENPVMNDEGYHDPCGKCASCIDIYTESYQRDVYLLGASQMGKGDIHKINDQAEVMSWNDANKIFIIDEAQDLSKAGKDSTLELLERKWNNVYYILCTMNEDAFEKEVKTRCQTYQFRPVKEDDIAGYLYNIIKTHEIEVPDSFIKEGLFYLTQIADGSVRAGIQYLERCIEGKLFTKELISQELRFVTDETMSRILFMLMEQDVNAFKELDKVDLRSFYYKSYATLIDMYKYVVAGYVNKDWKKKSYSKLPEDKYRLFNLIETYHTFMTLWTTYFNPTLFTSCLLTYFRNNKDQVPILTATKRTPVTQ